MEFSVRAKLVYLTVFSSSLALLLLLGTAHSASAASVKTNMPTKVAMAQLDGDVPTHLITPSLEPIERERYAAEAAKRYQEAYPRSYSYGGSSRPYSYGGSSRPYSYGGSSRPYSYGGSSRPYSYGGSSRPYSYGGSSRPYSYGGSSRPYSYGGSSRPYSYGGMYGGMR
ncbi:hypothetical protein [Ktedonospora formicarum]|uniref:hypothetical protein n=1 Tax=Ktedonospora formicarum TaxID=2778364 RepID=UPI001C68E24E|nr:hypothetical protein [Ktedonospora formicarum]